MSIHKTTPLHQTLRLKLMVQSGR